MHFEFDHYCCPLGAMLIVADDRGAVRALAFADHEPRMRQLLRTHYTACDLRRGSAPRQVTNALDQYFAGSLDALNDLPVMTGGTPFQQAVWQTLRQIPAGSTKSYGEIAAQLGRPAACRAVGVANGANPVAIIIPCHRVIGANGSLTGYGSGVHRKRWLLHHESGIGKGLNSGTQSLPTA